jgi:hypothetical protein
MSETISTLGVDLACRSWQDTGTALLSFAPGDRPAWHAVRSGVIPWPAKPVSAEAMAEVIDSFALQHKVEAVSLDGPQGWREPDADDRPGVGRWCEYLARTQGKTGTYGVTYPGTQAGWIRFCIEVFERLVAAGHARLVNEAAPLRLRRPEPGTYWLIECFPTQTWRSSNLAPLPGKSSRPPADVPGWAASLWQRYGLPQAGSWSGSHDDLQAVVACLPAAGLLGAPCVPIALGNPGRWIDAADARPRHWVEGLIWDAAPPAERLGLPLETPRRERVEPAVPVEPDADNPVLVDDREDGSEAITRGVRLFEYLAGRANGGDCVGIGYAQFVCFIHGVARFQDVANRQYLPSDTPHVVSLAHQVTAAAAGRRPVSRGSVLIQAGMDAFIWLAKRPYDRPQPAFQATPYTEQDWRTIFPDGARRLITLGELAALP